MNRQNLLVLGIFGLALTFRLVLALTYDGYLGVDGGAYLESVNHVLGRVDFWASFPRPPLAPGWLLAPFVLFLGDDVGYKIWTVLASISPLIPIYLLAKRFAGYWAGILAIVFASVDLTHTEMMVTGALPLIGFGLIGLAWWAMITLSAGPHRIASITLIASIGFIPWVNQTSAGLAIISLPIFFVGLWGFIYFTRTWIQRGPLLANMICHVAPAAFIGGLIALTALPWYLNTLPGSPTLAYDGPTFYLTSWRDWSVYQALLFSGPLGLFIAWKGNHYGLRSLGIMLILFACMVPWLSYDEVLINPPYRARYLTAVAFYPAIAWVVFRYAIPFLKEYLPEIPVKYAATTLAAVFFGVMVAGSVLVFNTQATTSAMMTPTNRQALDLVHGNITATNSFSLSFWTAAVARVPSPFLTTASPPPAYIKSDEYLRCLLGWIPGCNPRQAKQETGIEYLLIETRFPLTEENYMAPENQWEVTAQQTWLELIYSEGSTRLWRVAF